MRILIAEDEPVSRLMLKATLEKWGFQVVSTSDGEEAWSALQQDDPPQLALLDWMMPKLDGVALCRKVREKPSLVPPYILLLTGRDSPEDVTAGLEAGADDYVTKPFQPIELRARLEVGLRLLDLQRSLADRIRHLEESLLQNKRLHTLLPFCSCCKQIRDDWEFWNKVNAYVSAHGDDEFDHDVCPACYESRVKPELEHLWDSFQAPASPRSGSGGG